ncbi:putative GPI transamidase component Tta2 [Trypanosoma grayi]|uniref:putative GPI transamidase component Tta2 n=1 Tax=Trypanosoma grayi TaxID=71804 RepID=UPI0004F47CC7|nr:putative GPI transamidase component Tta2 [Trypanosoma grayi]KEG10018.1 putative GPI transamidase component Tta2 [Trypanosoma grayi]
MQGEKILSTPLVAVVVTLAVRFLTYSFKDQISLPYHFGITTPNTGAEIWKEAVFWKQEFNSVPDYITAVAPWYAEYIPPAPAGVYVTVLCLLDGLTAFIVSRWPSATPQFVYTLFVLNPAMILLPVLESLAPVEHFLLAIIIECSRRQRVQPWLMNIARLILPVLGFSFIAVAVALWFPIGTTSPKIALVGALLGAASIGGCGLLYLRLYGELRAQTSLYAPPDNGVMWYVRLLIIPAFERCMDVFQFQLPAILTMPLAVALPADAEAPTAPTLERTGVVPGNRRLLVVLFAICVSKACRCHLALPDYMLGVLFLYSLLDKTSRLGQRDGGTSMLERLRTANVFVPVYTLLLTVPLQYSFYTGWVMWDTANPNWVFFPQVAFTIVGGMFVLTFLKAAVEAISAEAAAGEKEKQL